MSDFQSSMVAPELSAGRLFSSSFAPPFDDQNIVGFRAKVLETSFGDQENDQAILEKVSKDMIRELAEHLMPGKTARFQIPELYKVLRKRVDRLTERRVRSIYNGEVERLWGDETDAIRRELAAVKNAKARKVFADAAAHLMRGLSAAGHPLSADQTSALHQLLRVAA